MDLTSEERATLDGHEGSLSQFAMELVVQAGRIWGADRLIPASWAHLDACHFYGQAHVDFARMLGEQGARFAVPTWGNTLPVSMDHTQARAQADPDFVAGAREVAQRYEALGARPVWTCAPYLLPDSPGFGDQIIGSESNAVAYYNAVVGARTQKYGDFLDVACALLGKVPHAGLHTDAGRKPDLVLDFSAVKSWDRDLSAALVGALMGQIAGSKVPLLIGVPPIFDDDALKNMAATGGATGGVTHFHIEGRTPEASATARFDHLPRHGLSDADLAQARTNLSQVTPGSRLSMVAVGTPHFSVSEFAALARLMDGQRAHPDLTFYVSSSRFVVEIAREEGSLAVLERAGVQVLVDTCTYFAPAVRAATGAVMTNSGKWAYYAPGMLPVQVALGSLADCAASAIRGELIYV